jgi:SHS2 domain-containing protein
MDEHLEGFLENEHTADWELHVWAQSLAGLFEQAARGMYSLCGVKFEMDSDPTCAVRLLHLEAGDAETLLVMYLSELLWIWERDGLGFEEFHLELEDTRMEGRLLGSRIVDQDKEIKAVTFHNLNIRNTDTGLEADLVFDV